MTVTSDQDLPSEIILTPSRRRFLAIAHLTVLLGYVIINRLISHMGGGATLNTVLDRYVPFWPAWVIPYLLAVIWCGVFISWAFMAMEDTLYVAFILGWICACLIGYGIFLIHPIYMVRPEVTGAGWAEWLIRIIYAADRSTNVFPSQHMWDTVIITLFLSRWKPAWRRPLWGFTLIVGLSVVFIGQHWIMDVIGGTLLGVIGYYLGLAIAVRLCPPPNRRHRRSGQ